VSPEIRVRKPDGEVEVIEPEPIPQFEEYVQEQAIPRRIGAGRSGELRIFTYGVSRNKVERAVRELGLRTQIVKLWEEADAVLTLKTHERRAASKIEEATRRGIPVHTLRGNTQHQVTAALREIYRLTQYSTEEHALREARQAIEEVLATSRPVELSPQNSYLRRLQHQLANQFELTSESVGVDPYRRVRIFK
jgi:hypothetical protein